MGTWKARPSMAGSTADTNSCWSPTLPLADRIEATLCTPSSCSISFAYAAENGCCVALETISCAVRVPLIALSVLAFADCPRIDINATRVSPIISALAVAAVRRGLRRVFSVASLPTVPNTRR